MSRANPVANASVRIPSVPKLLVVNILCHEKGIENEEPGLVVLHISILPSGD